MRDTPDKRNYQRLSSIVSERSRRKQNTIGRKDAGKVLFPKGLKESIIDSKTFFLAVLLS